MLFLFAFGAAATSMAVVVAGAGAGATAEAVVGASVGDPVIAAVGDIACDPGSPSYNGGAGTTWECRQRYTSDLAVGAGLTAVLGLGDLQYEDGTWAKFNQSYDASWGRVKSITYPAPGNHEYDSAGAAGYYDYFGPRAGDRTKGYYSFDIGAWHLIALNSECTAVGGCGPGSPQLAWLLQDLRSHASSACTLAFWHHPRFSSGQHGSDSTYQAFWQALYDHDADVVLVGHDHNYERFAPQTPLGVADPVRGIRQFVVGTGGKSLRPFPTVVANSEVRRSDTFGILKLTLHAASYDWAFVPEAGRTFTDTGSGTCQTPPAPTAAFSGSPTSGTAPLSVAFSDQSTGTPTSWAWDFDGNGTVDSTLQNPSFRYSAAGAYTVTLTASDAYGSDTEAKTDYVVVSPRAVADFDGDSDSDIAVFRPSNGLWAINGQRWAVFGQAEDVPVPGDYDGDGDTDIAIFRPSTGLWAINGQAWAVFGQAEDVPVPGDYDGDGDTDIAIFRPSTGLWAINGQAWAVFGQAEDVPVPGDYDGDRDTDVAIFRPSTGLWAIRGQAWAMFGQSGDVPVPGDYDGDRDTDVAIFRPSTGLWAIRGQAFAQFGQADDVPLPLPAALRSVVGP